MDLKKSWNFLNVYDLMIIALLVITAYNLSVFGLSNVTSIIPIIVSAVIVDLIINYIKEKRVLFPRSALISGLILSMVMQGPLLFLISVPAIAILSKHLIKIKGKHIFNPANFAFFIALFLPVSQSWWGASNLLLVFILGIAVIYKLKRLHLVLPFLAVHAAVMFALFSFDTNQIFNHIASGSLIFFVFYMLIEPITSPMKMRGRIIFGMLAGVFASILYMIWLPAMLVGALFFADLCVPLLSHRPVKRQEQKMQEDVPLTNPNL